MDVRVVRDRAPVESPLAALLAERLPKRFAQQWAGRTLRAMAGCRTARLTKPRRRSRTGRYSRPALGYNKAEVTLGGVDTRGLSSKTMEALAVPGLFFIGAGVDVTGHLGGFNFQWAWASGHAAGEAA